MKNKYSLVHLTNAACSPPEMIRVAAEAGFDCVSLRSIPTRMRRMESSVSEAVTGRMPFALSEEPELLRETRRAAEETGVEIHDTENARIFDGVQIMDYKCDLEAAASLGIRQVLTNIWTRDASFYEEAFASLCELAAPYGIQVNLEFVTWSGISDLKAAAALLRKVNQPNQGIVLDTLHFYRSGNVPEDLDRLPAEWFRYVHLCDCPREIPTDTEELIRTGLEERLIPGEGAVPFREILQRLPMVVRGLEVPNPERMEPLGYRAYAKLMLAKAKEYLEGENAG